MPSMILETNMESHDNPFLAEGQLSKKAEYIIKHSTINRTQVKIEDPDISGMSDAEVEQALHEELIAPETMVQAQSAPTSAARPNEIQVKENGKVEDPLTPQSVEVELKPNANASQPQKAEEVKLDKGKKCACCVVQ